MRNSSDRLRNLNACSLIGSAVGGRVLEVQPCYRKLVDTEGKF